MNNLSTSKREVRAIWQKYAAVRQRIRVLKSGKPLQYGRMRDMDEAAKKMIKRCRTILKG